ncbi:hypothetical protein RHMOL_Rhmol04G0320000 [Rhododendron molle]|uniref:Uncharacterized protein n=1 Tax=Rhododendron molle TaxID=49168 RepID=A0ACC0P6S3_RHOML|nr:hypothetical protein RHMOL_Rhmol04G0320000 [Rhododendron molle]
MGSCSSRSDNEVHAKDRRGAVKISLWTTVRFAGTISWISWAALIATSTFAAAFAITGGYDGNRGRDQGMVVLARATAFQAFVITNTIVMKCSVISIFLCITGLWYAYREDDKINDRAIARYFGAVVRILVAMFAIMFAFIAATFAVLAHSIALALSTCIIACIPFIAYTVELGKFISRVFF